MSNETRRVSPNPEDVWCKLVPGPYRADVMRALGMSIELAHQHGPERWGLRLASGPEGIMLKVGMHEVLQLVDGHPRLLFLIVDMHTVPDELRSLPELMFSGDGDCYGNRGAEGYYPSNPGSEACDMPFARVKETYQMLLKAHATVIARAANTRMNPTTPGTHSSALVQFVAEGLGKSLPQPAYWDMSDRYRPATNP
jgi:hypothetical protein